MLGSWVGMKEDVNEVEKSRRLMGESEGAAEEYEIV